jgi:aldehyde:ferredoxin oxidoreductase
VEGPEYETIALFGGNCVLKSIEEVAYANYLCDELGIDTISAGVVLGWAIECFQNGILTRGDIGKKIDFSDLDSVVFLLNKIAKREGIGDLLAEGVKVAAEKTGNGSDRFAIHVKGLEWSGYECRNAPSMMLAYLTADVGAHHNRAWVLGHDVAGAWTSVHDLIAAGGGDDAQPKAVVSKRSADYVIASQHTRSLFDALGNCRLQMMELGFEEEHYAELYSLITGTTRSWQDLLKISERIWHLTRAFSVREINDFGRHLDMPAARLYEEPIADGPNNGHVLSKGDIHNLLTWYYDARGWSENGIPKRETLANAGLFEVAQDLETRGIFEDNG